MFSSNIGTRAPSGLPGRTMRWLVHLLVIPPLAYVLWLVVNSGVLPDNDYWGLLGQILQADGFSANPKPWLIRGNEHIVFFPKLLFALNLLITGGSNIGLGILTVTLVLAQYVILWFLLPRDVRDRKTLAALMALILALFLFTPRAAHNWLLGMSGLTWFTANFFVVASLACIHKHSKENRGGWWLCSMLFAMAATLSYSTGLVVWPLLLIMAFFAPLVLRYRVATVGIAILVPVLISMTFERPGHHPEWVLDIARVVGAAIYMVSNVTKNGQIPGTGAYIVGGAAVAAGAVATMLTLMRPAVERRDILPWLLLVAYGLGNAVIAAMSRGGFGEQALTASRYAGLQALFWIGLLVSWLLLLRHRGRWGVITVSLVAAAMVTSMYITSWSHTQRLLDRAKLKPVAALAIRLGIDDSSVIKSSVTPAPIQLWSIVPALKRIGHVPFEQDKACPSFGLDLPGLGQRIERTGHLELVDQVAGTSAIRLIGRLPLKSEAIDCIVVVNDNDMVRGGGISGLARPDGDVVVTEDSTWLAYAKPEPGDQVLKIIVKTSDGQWRHVIDHRLGTSSAPAIEGGWQ